MVFMLVSVRLSEIVGRALSPCWPSKRTALGPLTLGFVSLLLVACSTPQSPLKEELGVGPRNTRVATAVRASSSVPAVFPPVKIGEREYVDGGLVSPVPVRFARQMGADVVLAVDISSPPEGNKADGMLQILLQTFSIMSKSINDFELKDADLVVKPQLTGVGSAAFNERKRSIEAGRAAMKAMLPQLKSLLEPR